MANLPQLDSTQTNNNMDEFAKLKTPKQLFGTELSAYSPARMVAAQAMGLKYPMIGEEAAEKIDKTGTYPGMLKDMIIVLFLCATPDKGKPQPAGLQPTGLNSINFAVINPETALELAIEWAGRMNICVAPSERYEQAVEVFGLIVSEPITQEFSVKSSDSGSAESPNVV